MKYIKGRFRISMNKRMTEIIRFVVTGIICFLIEFVILVALKSGLHLDTLIATPIAFLVSVTVNYLICLKWVFQGAEDNGAKTRAAFLFTSIIGLLLNELFMFLFRIIWGEETVLFTIFGFAFSLYMLNKIISTILVMIWNYFSKRAVIYGKQK